MTENPHHVPWRSLMLYPRPAGCAWVEDDHILRCVHPPIYVLTCSFTGRETQACALHTALMRHEHPDWIARVVSAQSDPTRGGQP